MTESAVRIDSPDSGRPCGGRALAAGSFLFVISIVAYVALYGTAVATGPEGELTLPDRAGHYLRLQQVAHVSWMIEAAAAIAFAVGGLTLMGSSRGGVRWLSARSAWATVAVGGLILVPMYPLMLGGYPLAASADTLTLFGALNGIATWIFNLGNFILFAGLTAAFIIEGDTGVSISSRMASIGALLSGIASLAALGMLAGIDAMAAAAPVGLIAFIAAGWMGIVIWRRG